jgi:hypothetical protein
MLFELPVGFEASWPECPIPRIVIPRSAGDDESAFLFVLRKEPRIPRSTWDDNMSFGLNTVFKSAI